MPNYPADVATHVERLRKYKNQKSWTNTQLAADMESFGWDWTVGRIDLLLSGRVTLSDEHKVFVEKYLAWAYWSESLS